MLVGKDDICRIAKLSKLSLSDSEIENAQAEFANMLVFFEKLQQLETDPALDAIHPDEKAPERVDLCVAADWDVTMNAPDAMCNMFAVPKVIE